MPIRRIPIDPSPDKSRALAREWLVTNGLGGYASGTIGGAATRRYHGLLVAALPAPLGRRLLLAQVEERARVRDGPALELGAGAAPGDGSEGGRLTEFRLELGLPVWRFDLGDGGVLERRVLLAHEQNTVFLIYELVDGAEPVRLKLRVSLQHRSHDAPVDTPLPGGFRLSEADGDYEFAVADLPPLRMLAYGSSQAFTVERKQLPEAHYSAEGARGYADRGPLWSPGYFRLVVAPGERAALVASTETWDAARALEPAAALAAEVERRRRRLAVAGCASRDDMTAELVLAADQFVVKPVGRASDVAELLAEGEESRTVIAGYYWFTDWGRDTMISLDGLTLATGRHTEARSILQTFAHSLRDGLLPNLFPEGENDGLYHTADATLWFFHAIDRYVRATGDRVTLATLLPRLVEVAERHLAGTRFGIGVDPGDGLLRQGAAGLQLTWMDAKVGEWVVTPRRGKAVEINALWYNALELLADWLRDADQATDAASWQRHAERARASFNRRFWYAAGGYLYDVVDGEAGDDAACRPNQIFAISLQHPVLERQRWVPVLEVTRERLLTPLGLRTLSREHADYRAVYCGDIRARDAAYHQGTVWPWLIGAFVDAWLKAHPADGAKARRFLAGFDAHLSDGCIGTISEIFDAEPPFLPRGCVAQAWSVAEVLRAWRKTAVND